MTIIPPNLQLMLLQLAQSGAPEEVCGLVAGKNGLAQAVYPIENRLHSPNFFEMEPEGLLQVLIQIERESLDILGVYHSHPNGPQEPSPMDYELHVFPEATLIILSPQKGIWELNEYSFKGSVQGHA